MAPQARGASQGIRRPEEGGARDGPTDTPRARSSSAKPPPHTTPSVQLGSWEAQGTLLESSLPVTRERLALPDYGCNGCGKIAPTEGRPKAQGRHIANETYGLLSMLP